MSLLEPIKYRKDRATQP